MRAGTVMVALAAMTWGTWSLFLFPTHLPAQATMPIIFLIMGVTALPAIAFDPPQAAPWDRATVQLLIANAALDAGNGMSFFAAYDRTTVAIAVLTHYAAPILIALAAPFIDGTTVRGTRPAAAIALGGLVIVLEPWRSPTSGALAGAALGLMSAACYAGNVFVVRRLAARIGAGRALAYHSLIAAGLTAPIGIAWYADATWGGLALLAAGALVVGTAAGLAFIIGLGRIGSARAAVLTFAEPLVAVAVGAVVWGQTLHPLAAIGGALVLAAGVHVARQAR
jgi:drug/metabolite transporter (DMT)-like permease